MNKYFTGMPKQSALHKKDHVAEGYADLLVVALVGIGDGDPDWFDCHGAIGRFFKYKGRRMSYEFGCNTHGVPFVPIVWSPLPPWWNTAATLDAKEIVAMGLPKPKKVPVYGGQ